MTTTRRSSSSGSGGTGGRKKSRRIAAAATAARQKMATATARKKAAAAAAKSKPKTKPKAKAKSAKSAAPKQQATAAAATAPKKATPGAAKAPPKPSKPQPLLQKQQPPQPQPQPRRHRVLVVGAGISGLAAARELMYRRYDVLVLEGRTRPGGRLRTLPMRLPRDRRINKGGNGNGNGDGDGNMDGIEGEDDGGQRKKRRAAAGGGNGDDTDDNNNDNNNNDDNSRSRSRSRKRRSGSSSASMSSVGGMGGMASRLMSSLLSSTSVVGSFMAAGTGAGTGGTTKSGGTTGTKTGRRSASSGKASAETAAAKAVAGKSNSASASSSSSSSATTATQERRQTRGVLKQEEQDQRRSTRSQTLATPVKPPGRYYDSSFDTSTTSQKKKRKRPSVTSSSFAAAGGAGDDDDNSNLPPVHPLDQRYSTRLFAQENARTDIDYELVPVDLGGAFIHGTGYETDVKTGKASRLDWGTSSGGTSGGNGKKGGVGGKAKSKMPKSPKADINPLYQLVRSMGIATVPLDGCTLMDAHGNNVDDVKSSDGGGGGGDEGDGSGSGSLDEFVQSKFNEILDDCHDVISQLKRLERAAQRREAEDSSPAKKKQRRTTNGGSNSARNSTRKRSPSTLTTSAEISVKLPDGTKATPSTDFATLFNSIASSKSIFLSGKSTLPADLFSWHLNNLEMSCGAPFPALGLKWNEDERYNFGGDHVVLADGWGRVIENLAEGSVASASAGEGNGPVNIRYGCEVEGIRIVPPEDYAGDLVEDVDDQGDDLSDYEALESDDDDGSEDESEDEVLTAKKPAAKAKAKPAAKPKPKKPTPKKPAPAKATASTPPPTRVRGDAGDAVKTRSRSKFRRSSRSNIGQLDMDSASRYSPTFESDLKKFSPIKATPSKPKKKESVTPKGQSSKKKPAAAEPMILSPDSSRDPDVHNSTVQVRTKLADGTIHTYEADHVIVTCPLGVLQVPCGEPGHVVFNPPLPRYKRESISKIGFGHYNKIALAFPYRFWDELPGDDFWGVAASPENRLGGSILAVDLGRAHTKSGGGDDAKDVPVMLLIFGGSYAKKMESRSDEELVGDAMEVVRNAWESKLKKRSGEDTVVPETVDFAVTRWGQDRFARGSFSYVKPGADGFVENLKLARPVFDPYGPVVSSAPTSGKCKGRGQRSKKDGPDETKRPMILFAGEHTSSVYPSTIHGAFLSGVREATRLDLALEPAMNSYHEFDNKTVYGRTFDLNWRSRRGGLNAIGAASAKKKRKGTIKVSSQGDAETSRVMLEDATILRGCDVHGTSVDSVARVSELNFPIPAAHAVSGKRMTSKAISRRYIELDGCTMTRPPVDEKSWLVDEDQVYISGDGDGSEEELYFDWSAAAEIEQEHDKEGED